MGRSAAKAGSFIGIPRARLPIANIGTGSGVPFRSFRTPTSARQARPSWRDAELCDCSE